MKRCYTCKADKEDKDYILYKRGLGGSCRSCQLKYKREWYIKNRDEHVRKVRTNQIKRRKELSELLNAYKVERGCTDCGYRLHAEALDFDHLDSKKFGISAARHSLKPMAEIKKEIEKCEVVCANCHRVRTANRRK